MSLDEWKAIQEQSRPKAEFNIRKADTKLPPKAVVIHKSKRLKVFWMILHRRLQMCCLFAHIHFFAIRVVYKERGLGLNEEDLVCRRPTNDITCQVDINFGSLGRPSRGGRGGRGGRGRGAPATQRSLQKDSEVVSVHENMHAMLIYF